MLLSSLSSGLTYTVQTRIFAMLLHNHLAIYQRGTDGAADAMGSKGLADAFSRKVLKAWTRRTVVYMISTFPAPYSWLNGVALALVPPRGTRYWSTEG